MAKESTNCPICSGNLGLMIKEKKADVCDKPMCNLVFGILTLLKETEERMAVERLKKVLK